MAIYYVSSAATGTADGSSYTNAVTTFAAGVAKLAAGDSLYVLSTHSESTGAATTYTFPGTNALPNFILCTDSSNNLTTGASITATTMAMAGSAYLYGMTFVASAASSSAIGLANVTGSWQKFVSCAFSMTSTGTTVMTLGISLGQGPRIEWLNTTVKFAGAGNSLKCDCNFTWKNTASAVSGVVPTTLFLQASNCVARLEGVDLSFCTGTLVGAPVSGQALFDIKDCKVAAATTWAATPTLIGPQIQTSRTAATGTNYLTNYITYRGTQSTEAVLVRTGGASDGTTAISQKIVTTANTSWASNFELPPIVIWNATTATNRVITLRGIMNAAALPLNDAFWIDVEYLGDSASGLGSTATGTKANVLATGAAQAADTSAWDSLVTARANNTAYTVGQMIKVPDNAGRVFFCTTAGTSALLAEPAGYANAVDGGSVTDNGATFRAGVRFTLTVTLSSPQPQQAGYIYVYPKVGAASSTFWLDPLITLG